MTDSNYTSWSEDLVIYVESLCCIPETHIIMYSNLLQLKKYVKRYMSFNFESISIPFLIFQTYLMGKLLQQVLK